MRGGCPMSNRPTAGMIGALALLLAAVPWTRAAAGSFVVGVADGTLSVHADDAPLVRVLDDIAAKSGIRVVASRAAAERTINAHFVRLPFAAGLDRLLRDEASYILERDPVRGYAGIGVLRLLAGASARAAAPPPQDALRTLVADPAAPAPAIPPGGAVTPLDPAAAAQSQARSLESLHTVMQDLDNGTKADRVRAQALREQLRGPERAP